MISTKKYLIAFFLLAIILAGGFFYFRSKIYYSHGNYDKNIIFEIKKGEGNAEISANLKDKGIISGKVYFWIYLKSHRLLNKIYPGEYLLNGKMTIPEVAVIITNSKKSYEKVLFTEGMTAKQMSEELNNHGFDGGAFLTLINNPSEDIISQFAFFSDHPKGATLEGYLFPDTYYFSKEATPEGILKKILNNTEAKITDDLRNEIKSQGKTIFEILTLASIIEKEVDNDSDRAVVSGIFWNRLDIGQPLQSDATLTYILGDKNSQHTFEQTKIDSPYNSYLNKGLPPGPISNPGISSISAAVYPKKTNYNYFLSDPNTGKTIFSETYEEHVANKAKYGL
jgi:UPF0755 protein